jgi:hypothetical protein
MTKYIAKQDRASGKWAIFERTGNKENKANDKFVRFVEHGMHTACAIADGMNRK